MSGGRERVSENGIEQAEKRVREMNMMARQFNEQGNRFMRQTRNPPQNRQSSPPPQPRFEAVGNKPPVQQSVTYNGGAGRRTNISQTPVNEPEPVRVPEAKEPPREESSADTLFSGLNIDGEKLLILLLICLLIKEKADIKLILALGYLLM